MSISRLGVKVVSLHILSFRVQSGQARSHLFSPTNLQNPRKSHWRGHPKNFATVTGHFDTTKLRYLSSIWWWYATHMPARGRVLAASHRTSPERIPILDAYLLDVPWNARSLD